LYFEKPIIKQLLTCPK